MIPISPLNLSFSPDFMQQAIDLAHKGIVSGAGGPFGALVVREGRVIATGSNRVTSSNDPTAHAEVVAIRAACSVLGHFQLQGCDLYTTCEPCPMCLGAIYWARPDRVFYACTRHDAAQAGFDDQFIYDEINIELSVRRIPFIPQMRPEALYLFDAWRNKTDKTPY